MGDPTEGIDNSRSGTDAAPDKTPPPDTKGDLSQKVTGAKDHPFAAGGNIPGVGSWRSEDDGLGSASPNDDGQSLTLEMAPDRISGSRHGANTGHPTAHPSADHGRQQSPSAHADRGSESEPGTKTRDRPGNATEIPKGRADGQSPKSGVEGGTNTDKAEAGKRGASDKGFADKDDRGLGVKGEHPAPSNPGGLNAFEQALDDIVNPNAVEHPLLRGVMDNMNKRGEGFVDSVLKGRQHQSEFFNALGEGRVSDAINMRAKEAVDLAEGVVVGFGTSVKTAGNAFGDLAYYGIMHSDEPGAEGKVGSAAVDAVIETANIVGALDGAAGLAKGGASKLGALRGETGAAAEAGVAGGKNTISGGQGALGGGGKPVGPSAAEANAAKPAAGGTGKSGGGGKPPEPPAMKGQPKGGPDPAQNTDQIFREIKNELAGIKEAPGQPSVRAHTPLQPSADAPPTGIFRKDGGHHPNQGANYVSKGTPTRQGPGYQDGVTVPLGDIEHANVHRVTDSVNRGMHGADVSKEVGRTTIEVSGDGTRSAIGDPPANPWTPELTGYHGLRASGSPIYGTPQAALDVMIKSSEKLSQAGVTPVRVPKR